MESLDRPTSSHMRQLIAYDSMPKGQRMDIRDRCLQCASDNHADAAIKYHDYVYGDRLLPKCVRLPARYLSRLSCDIRLSEISPNGVDP